MIRTIHRNKGRICWQSQPDKQVCITTLKPLQPFGLSPLLEYRFLYLKPDHIIEGGIQIYRAYYINRRFKIRFTYVWQGWTVFIKPGTLKAKY